MTDIFQPSPNADGIPTMRDAINATDALQPEEILAKNFAQLKDEFRELQARVADLEERLAKIEGQA